MKFLLYSDKKYESLIECFLISRKYAGVEHIPVIYYSLNFKSNLDYENLEVREWNTDIFYPKFNFYKPSIILDALQYDDQICYMDSDILLSKNFTPVLIKNEDYDFPISSSGPQEYPYVWILLSNGETLIRDETTLMKYYGIEKRTCDYVWSSMISCNKKCIDFLEEWDSIISNKYFQKNHEIYFPFQDETSLNVLLWKRGVSFTLDNIFFNTVSFDSFEMVENEQIRSIGRTWNDITINLDPKIYEMCNDPSKVLFYHGFKYGEELDKTISWMKSKI
jgi:hypothetical protein